MIGNRKIVSLCTARLHEPQNFNFITTMNKRLADENISILAFNITTDCDWDENMDVAECNIYDLIDYEISDVIVIMDEQIKSRNISLKIIERAKKYNKPVIIINGKYDDCHSISFDYLHGFELITRHVIEHHKARDVIFMGGIPGNPFSDERERIFKKVLKDNGIPFKKNMVAYGYFWAGATQDAMQDIILSGHIPEAIICANDIMAINVEIMLQKFGINVPEKVIVTGFDGIDEIYLSSIQISSVLCNHTSVANTVAQNIIQMLSGKKVPKKILIKPELILAGSCGCNPEYIDPPSHYSKLYDHYLTFPEITKNVFRNIEKMQASTSLAAASNSMDKTLLHSMTVAINPSLMTSPGAVSHRDSQDYPFEREMILFYDSGARDSIKKPTKPEPFQRKSLVPNIDRLLENGYPLIFNELDSIDSPIGYVCFHFEQYNLKHYSRIPIIVTALRTSIGGFAGMQYQRLLVEQLDASYKLDSLTGLYNRQGFNRKFKQMQNRLKKSGANLTVILSDLDRLKKINDVYGHAAGDNAIKQIAASLIKSCPPKALCVRFGGDEMMAVIEGDVDADEIKAKIEKYQHDYNEKSNLPYKVRSSIGIFRTNGSGDIDFETLVKQADKSLYDEKVRHHQEH